MRMNASMRGLLAGGPRSELDIRSRSDLVDVLDAGWLIGPEGALLVARCWGSGWTRKLDPADVGQYEYEVNDVYISLDDLASDMNTYLSRAAERGLAFAERMLLEAAHLPKSDRLHAAVSVSVVKDEDDFLEQGAVVRFFTDRGRHPDWYDDLERFKSEAIAVLDLGDVIDRGR